MGKRQPSFRDLPLKERLAILEALRIANEARRGEQPITDDNELVDAAELATLKEMWGES